MKNQKYPYIDMYGREIRLLKEEIATYMEEDFDYYELPITYGEWDEYFEYEKYEDSYTTPNGETVVAFGYYGMDM